MSSDKLMPQLKTCPFCGSNDVEVHHRGGRVEIVCKGDSTYDPASLYCAASICGDTEAFAIAAWNTRSDTAERDALRGYVRGLLELAGYALKGYDMNDDWREGILNEARAALEQSAPNPEKEM